MRRFRGLFLGACLVALAGGSLLVNSSPSFAQRGQERREEQNYWRYHGGRWSHWDAGDKRWYYTDGSHWYYNNGKAWEPYRFDKSFGRQNFERGTYVLPSEGAQIVVPTHEIFVHK
jgi:hypothetical protein